MTVRAYERYALNSSDLAARTPAHWRVLRLRYAVDLNPSARRAGLKPEQEVSFLPMEAIGDDGTIDRGRTCVVGEASSGYSYFADGDVVLAKITPCFENGKAAQLQELHGGHGFGTTELIVVRPEGALMLSHFLYYVVHSSVFRDLGTAHMYGAGGQKRVPDEFVRNLRVALPPMPEQHHIVAFLDRETAKIDALVAEQRRLTELLQEKRQAVISHAVTKGLNPDAPMKPSGVEWLGEVPAHWSIVPLMRLTPTDRQIMYGIVLPGPDVDGGVPIVKGGDVSPERLRLGTLKRTTAEIEAGYVRSRLRAGDLVYSIRGSIGEVEMVPAEIEGANITQDVARVAPIAGVHGRWLLWALRSSELFAQLDYSATGATIRGINIFSLKRARVPVPSAGGQVAIAHFLDSNVGELDDTMDAAAHAVELLQERRAALISAAVTGQIDVRQLAAAEAA